MGMGSGGSDFVYDTLIVGGGSAGLSAALVLGRSRREVLIIDDGHPRNAVVESSHGYMTRDGQPPAEFVAMARVELEAYPSVAFLHDTVLTAKKMDEHFSITVATGETFTGKTLLMATGVFDSLPDIDGIVELWGKSVFVCPFCDGWELRDQRIAVQGAGREAVGLAQELYGWTKDLVICMEHDTLTDHDRRWIDASHVDVVVGRIRRMYTVDAATILTFDDGAIDDIRCRALFVCAPLRQHSPLFMSLGCKLGDDGLIKVDGGFQTTVRGCYAAGDSVTPRHQIIIAAASGAVAAITLNCNLLEAEAKVLAATSPSGEVSIHRL